MSVKVMVVDDDPINLMMARTILTKLGCAVDVANNGAEALALADAAAYGLILMDCHMPLMDGFTATRKLRERPGPRQYVVGLTGNAGDAQVRECLDAGMDAVLSKPVQLADFRRLVAQLTDMPA